MKTQAGKSVEQVIRGIQDMDLEPIKFKLMDPDDGPGWTREYVEEMELAYRRFLTLVVKYPDETIAPTRDIDTFWHGHILDTLKYAEDCQRVFGYFVHHYPYFGMRGDADVVKQASASEALGRLYSREFGNLPQRPVMTGAAHCVVAREAAPDAAHCVVAREAGAQDAAHCVVAREALAHCVVAREAVQDSAHCVVAREAGAQEAAHCVVAFEASAHCVVAREAAQDSAHCVVAREAGAQDAAHCVVASPGDPRRMTSLA